MYKLVRVLSLICVIAPSSYAETGTVTAQFKVTANITDGCVFSGSNTSNVSLPALLPTGNGVTQSTSFQLLCTPGMTAKISINNGEHADKAGNWNLALDGQTDVMIPYRVYYVSSTQKTLWNSPITFNSDAAEKKIDLEIDVPQPQALLRPGHYSDTDIITVSY